ncbi:MAG: hypothetical protein ACREUV_09050 [Burkholderiales bacterium]
MNEQTKQLIKTITAVVCFILALAGVVGLAYRIFSPGGWLEQALGKVWDMQVNYSIMTIPVLIGAVVLGGYLFSDKFDKGGKLGNFITYAFMALGLYFIARFLFF